MCRRFPAAGVSITPTLVTVQQILVPLDHLRALVTDDAGKVDLRDGISRRYLNRLGAAHLEAVPRRLTRFIKNRRGITWRKARRR